jgi:hypothetical protein
MERERDFVDLVARVRAAQMSDGYLNTYFGRPGQGERWSDLEWGHELYCLGHLFQAAVARQRTAPNATDGLIDIAVSAADLVCEVFGSDGIQSVCGHAEVEAGLAELGRVLMRRRYVEQATLFIERRGQGTLRDIEWGRSYYQDDVAVRQATSLRGHAVRANYLASGAVDVAIETGDDELLDALRRQWAHAVARRTYITGGQGSHHQDEAFGEDWVLPPDRAYSETCASVASIQFTWRLLLASGGAAYADLIERTLYNVVATSPSEEGTSFYYANTLYQRRPGQVADADAVSPRASSSLRAPWFEVSCCPPNVARTFASLGAYLATVDNDGLQLHQYAKSSVRTTLSDGTRVALDVETDYPNDGVIRATMVEDSPRPWTLTLRVPSWASQGRLVVRPTDAAESETAVTSGYADCRRAFRKGDTVELHLPMDPRLVTPDTRIDAIRGCAAVERGPLVYCVESVDLAEAGLTTISDDLTGIQLDASLPLSFDGTTVRASIAVRPTPHHDDWPYVAPTLSPGDLSVASTEVAMTPYHSWSNRGPSTMRVWIPIADS